MLGFLNVLQGRNVTFEGEEESDIDTIKQELICKWNGWKFGFSHFVELTEMPTDDCLWYLLSRRAAGALTIRQNAVDLLVPIFTCDSTGNNAQVSMIVVHAMDFGCEAISSERLSSSFPKMFRNYSKRPEETIRVSMSFGGQLQPSRFYRKDVKQKVSSGKDSAVEASYVLFKNGIETGSFVPQDVADQLDLLLAPWWSIMRLVDANLERRKKCTPGLAYRLPNETYGEIAALPYSKLLCIDNESENKLPAEGKKKKRQKTGSLS